MVTTARWCAWAAAAAAVAASAAEAQEWTTMTLYDVLQEDCRQNITNKDLGDPAGDAYFMLKDMYLPVACPVCSKLPEGCAVPATFDCGNPESEGNRVVRKVTVEVVPEWGSYELCNQNSTADCDYRCFALTREPVPGVGMQEVCGGDHRACDMAPTPSHFLHTPFEWEYWDFNTAVLMGQYTPDASQLRRSEDSKEAAATGTATTGQGKWYSFNGKYAGTHWRNVTIEKTINAECHWRNVLQAVRAKNTSCFDACPGTGGTNVTDACYVGCFFETLLGAGAGNSTTPTGGMTPDEVTAAWLGGFQSDDPSSGGCPPCPAQGACPPPAWMH